MAANLFPSLSLPRSPTYILSFSDFKRIFGVCGDSLRLGEYSVIVVFSSEISRTPSGVDTVGRRLHSATLVWV